MSFFVPTHGLGIRGRGGGGGQKGPPPQNLSHISPTMMKLGIVTPYLKKIQKIYESRDTPLAFS